MKLKRYVLLDNNRIFDREKLDTTNAYGHLMSNIFNAIENKKENICRQLVATSDDVTDLIIIGDIVKYTNSYGFIEINQVYGVDKYYLLTRLGGIIYKEKILAIYKLIDKDYISVWEKEDE